MILLRVLSIRRQMHTNCGEWVSQYCLPHLIHQQIFYDWQTEQAHVYIWNDSDSLFMVQWDLILSTFNFLCINLKIHICFKALSHLYCHIFIFSLDKYAKLFINVSKLVSKKIACIKFHLSETLWQMHFFMCIFMDNFRMMQ